MRRATSDIAKAPQLNSLLTADFLVYAGRHSAMPSALNESRSQYGDVLHQAMGSTMYRAPELRLESDSTVSNEAVGAQVCDCGDIGDDADAAIRHKSAMLRGIRPARRSGGRSTDRECILADDRGANAEARKYDYYHHRYPRERAVGAPDSPVVLNVVEHAKRRHSDGHRCPIRAPRLGVGRPGGRAREHAPNNS